MSEQEILKEEKHSRVCEWCSSNIKCKPSERRRFCSRLCWNNANDKRRTFKCTYCKCDYKIPKEGKAPLGKPFCSRNCWNKYQTGSNNSMWCDSKSSVICTICNNEFSIKTKKRRLSARYCSVACRTIDYQKNGYPKDTRISIPCSVCSNDIKVRKVNLGDRKFCNRECSDKAHSIFARGTNNGRYIHGDNMSIYPPGWTRKFKMAIRERDCNRCKLCKSESKRTLHVHHIDYDVKNLSLNNLISLCNSCHSKMHGGKESRMEWGKKLSNLLGE